MVMRKPLPTADSVLQPQSDPPYPTTPTANTFNPPTTQRQDRRSDFSGSDAGSTNSWEEEAISKHSTGAGNLPSSLKVGPPGYTPKTSHETLAPSNTNPFLARQHTSNSNNGSSESSTNPWGSSEMFAPPTMAPPPPPVPQGMANVLYRQQF